MRCMLVPTGTTAYPCHMAILTDSNGNKSGLRSRHLIGRSRAMHTRIDRPDVSAQHAVIAWMGGRWCIRDLGSRNGTRVNGDRLEAGQDRLLNAGDSIVCGTDSAAFTLTSDDAPGPFAISDATLILGEDDALGIPSLEAPELLIQTDREGDWVVESDDGVSKAIADGSVVRVAGIEWKLVLPEPIAETVEQRAAALTVDDVALTFRVSRDEEFVEVDVQTPAGTSTLPARAHHYTTLLLARARIADAKAGLDPSEQGWVHAEELQKMLRQSNARINLSLHRARRELEKLGISNPHDLFERRSTSRQVRIGVATLSEATL